MSDSSLIQAPNAGEKDSIKIDLPHDDTPDGALPRNVKLMRKTICDAIQRFLQYLFDCAVAFVAAFVAAVMAQENVQTAFCNLIVKAMNEFMDQDDFGDKFDSAVRRVIYDKERRRVASRDIGKEVVPLVSGFVGGVAESLRPSIMKKKTKKLDSNGSSEMDTSSGSSTLVGAVIVEEVEMELKESDDDKKSK